MFALLIGCLVVFVSMTIQVIAVVVLLRYLLRLVNDPNRAHPGVGFDFYVISAVLVFLFVGHLLQIAVWAVLFMLIGEFSDFPTAMYHSMVNFASLGYGDIVMSEQWRMLGAVESSIGVLMFGLSAGIMMAIMAPLFARHSPSREQMQAALRATAEKD